MPDMALVRTRREAACLFRRRAGGAPQNSTLGGKGGDMRRLLPLIILVGLGVGQASLAFGQSRIVDLDAPGALDALAHDNPQHYGKVREIMADVQKRPDSEVPQWMRTRFDASDVNYGPLLIVTDPPKRRLSFTIDEVRYRSTVTLTNWKPQLMPAK
jgi:hypothetical protein